MTKRWNLLNGGFVELVRSMGGDDSVVEAARVTSGARKSRKSPEQLIRYLMRHGHDSPFEFCQLEFHVRAPIYVARQWVRHRTASWNEVSGRYVEFKEDYQDQAKWRGQAQVNRQGSEGEVEYDPLTFNAACDTCSAEDVAFLEYNARIEAGVAKEQARTCLPVSTWTEWRWSVDLRNCLHFLALRSSQHAQPEIRAYAEAMVPMVESVAPATVAAWRDYRRDALTLSVRDLRALSAWPLGERPSLENLMHNVGVCMSEGEALEHLEKRERLIRGGR